jgi:hypothetical protein
MATAEQSRTKLGEISVSNLPNAVTGVRFHLACPLWHVEYKPKSRSLRMQHNDRLCHGGFQCVQVYR